MAERDASRPILFVGLGKMGFPMARRLLGAGFAVRGLDASTTAMTAFAAEAGALPVASIADAARDADVVVTMLPTSAIVRAVLPGGADALGPARREGTTVIEMSSGVPTVTVDVAAALRATGVRTIDAPVSGGVARAEKGMLTIMAGGDEAEIDAVRPVLSAMGNAIQLTGPVGSGQAMKALNNLVSAGGFLIGVEALLIGRKFGLDPARMVEVLNGSSGRSNSSETKFAQFVLSRSFASGFGLDPMSKDLGIALSIAEQTDTAAPFSALCRSMWAAASKACGPGLDHTEMARLTELIGGGRITDPMAHN